MNDKKIKESKERLQKLQKESDFLKKRYNYLTRQEAKTGQLSFLPVNRIKKQEKIKRQRIIHLKKRINEINEEIKNINMPAKIRHENKYNPGKKENMLKKIWLFLKADTWQSWLVSIVLIVIFIKLIFFPTLSFLTGSPLPLVVIESCSMYHESDFEEWWYKNSEWYESKGITKSEFLSFPYKNGLDKGDIILLLGKEQYNIGEVIIFNAGVQHPLIHRIVSLNPLSTKGDHNSNQLEIERTIQGKAVIGKAAFRIPLLGWIKLIFFEPFRPAAERGLCR